MTPELAALVSAVRDKGNHPDYHDQQMALLQRDWPTLHTAVTRLVEKAEKER